MKFTWKDKDWYIDERLATQLNSIAWNIKSDWDFVIILTGDRMVRVGKSVLAQTICAYLALLFKKMNLNDNAYNIGDVYFDNKEMIKEAFKKPKYSINHYDEGREGLAASKAMKGFQQDLIDFFTECGQMNHVFVIVAPDFFELKEEIAVGRSEILLNVYRRSEMAKRQLFRDGTEYPVVIFKRGYFQFFARNKKAKLFDIFRTTRRKSYGTVTADFLGRFTDQYPLGEEEYKKLKREALSRFQENKEKEKLKIQSGSKHLLALRDLVLKQIWQENPKLTNKEIAKRLNEQTGGDLFTQVYISHALCDIKKAAKEGVEDV